MKPASLSATEGERFNAGTHLAGSLLAAVGVAVLLARAIREDDVWKIGSFAVYGSALLALYLSSTLYHASSGSIRHRFQRLDRAFVYVLIAGSYTPFALVSLRGARGFALFGGIWTAAAAGAFHEVFTPRRVRAVSVSLCFAMGLLGLTALGPLRIALGTAGLEFLLAGDVLYTLGVIFYLLDEKWTFAHGVFHLFVLGGSALHFLVVLRFVS